MAQLQLLQVNNLPERENIFFSLLYYKIDFGNIFEKNVISVAQAGKCQSETK